MYIDFKDPQKTNANNKIAKKKKSLFSFKKKKEKTEPKTIEEKPMQKSKIELQESPKEEKTKKEITILDKINSAILKESEHKESSKNNLSASEHNNLENISIENSKETKSLNLVQESSTLLESTDTNSLDSKTTIPNTLPSVPKIGKAGFEAFEFRGTASEYFKIWIVNIALTLLTLGIYSAWAKVRSLRYIYGNTYLNNSNFEFNAEPKRILIGRIIIVAFYGLFLLFSDYLAMYKIAAGIFVAFLLILPWLIRQAINFKLKSASYRNIPFKFHAKTRSFYWLVIIGIFSIIPLPIIIALLSRVNPEIAMTLAFVSYLLIFVIVIPLLYRKYKYLVINNASYANEFFKFTATKKTTIGVFLKISFLTFAVSMIIGVIATITIEMGNSLLASFHLNLPLDPKYTKYIIMIPFMLVYLFSIGMYKGISDGYFSNFVRNHTEIKDAKFKGEISPFKLGLISATNAIVLLFSLGLLYPWTKLRYLRYKIENTYFACSDYDQFVSDGYEKINPLGEEALDFFDIDIGV